MFCSLCDCGSNLVDGCHCFMVFCLHSDKSHVLDRPDTWGWKLKSESKTAPNVPCFGWSLDAFVTTGDGCDICSGKLCLGSDGQKLLSLHYSIWESCRPAKLWPQQCASQELGLLGTCRLCSNFLPSIPRATQNECQLCRFWLGFYILDHVIILPVFSLFHWIWSSLAFGPRTRGPGGLTPGTLACGCCLCCVFMSIIIYPRFLVFIQCFWLDSVVHRCHHVVFLTLFSRLTTLTTMLEYICIECWAIRLLGAVLIRLVVG